MPTSAFFETVKIDEQRPRLLLLSKHFPPSEETGALRWQKIAGSVASMGWGFDVITLHPAELSTRDDRRLLDLPSDTRVFGVRSRMSGWERAANSISRIKQRVSSVTVLRGSATRDVGIKKTVGSIGRAEAKGPFHSASDLRRWYHAQSWRAAELAWAEDVARVAAGITEAATVIVSCGPPHQVHVAGEQLSRRSGIPLVMDMRDPWSLVERVPEPFGSSALWRQAERDEARCIAAASLIVVNTEGHRRALQERYPEAAGRIIAVLNGFDEEPVVVRPPGDAFTITYAGTLYLDRDPRALLQAVAALVRERTLGPHELRLVFLGDIQSYGGATMGSMATEAGIAEFVEVVGRKPRAEALTELAKADVLVVLPQDSHLAVPSKVYEYMLFPAWILAMAAPESSLATTLEGTGADVVLPFDVEGITSVLRRRYDERTASGRPDPISKSVPHLSRTKQGMRLLGEIARLMPVNARG